MNTYNHRIHSHHRCVCSNGGKSSFKTNLFAHTESGCSNNERCKQKRNRMYIRSCNYVRAINSCREEKYRLVKRMGSDDYNFGRHDHYSIDLT